MRKIIKKSNLMIAITAKVWTETEISKGRKAANLVFRINLQKTAAEKKVLIVQDEFDKINCIE